MAGVYYEPTRKKYVARPTVHGKKVYLGRFGTKNEAELAVGLHFARLNYPTTQLKESPNYEIVKDSYAARNMQLEETKSTSIFDRIKGRLRKHSI